MLEYDIADRTSPILIEGRPWEALVTIKALNEKGLVPPFEGNDPNYSILPAGLYDINVIGVMQEFDSKKDYDDFVGRYNSRWKLTEDGWNNAHWPPVIFGGGDLTYHHDGSFKGTIKINEVETDLPKPTWRQVLTVSMERRIRYFRGTQRPLVEYIADASNNALISEIKAYEPEVSLDPDEGIDHLPAVVHQISRSASAGETNRVSVLRDQDQNPKFLWTETDKTTILDPVAEKSVLVGSAVNLVKGRIRKLEKIAYSLDGGLPAGASEHEKVSARYAALAKATALAQSDKLDSDIVLEMDRIQGMRLPGDLEKAKLVLAERLEAVATGRQKRLKSALSQQAIDNWAACVDQDTAMQEIARHCALGSRAIAKADNTVWEKNAGAWTKSSFADFILSLPPGDRVPGADVQHEGEGDPDVSLGDDGEFYRDTASGITEAKATFNLFKKEIESVTAANTPWWVVNGVDVDESFPARQSVSGRTLRVRAVQPTGANVAGDVDIRPIPLVVDAATGNPALNIRTLRRPADPLEHEIVIVLPLAVTKPVKVKIEASNLCGPSEIEILMTP